MTDLEIEGIGPATLIGGGGSASVFVATRSAFGDRVAVKVLKQTLTDTDSQRHFRREVRALQELAEAPGIVAVLDSGFTRRGEPYLVLPLFAGSAQDGMGSGDADWKRATRLVADAARAVGHAHRQGIFHRDIKPANLLLTDSDDVFVTDFGIAVLTESSMSAAGWLAFTPGYAPPEAFEGAAPSAAWDVYSLGASLAALVTGRAPFEVTEDESLLAIVRRITDEPPPDLRAHGVPDRIASIVERCMAKSPSDRPATVDQVADELMAALGGDAPGGSPANAPGSAPSPSGGTAEATRRAAAGAAPDVGEPLPDPSSTGGRPRWLLPALAAVAVAAIVIGLVVGFGGGDDAADSPTATVEPTDADTVSDDETPTEAEPTEPPAPTEPATAPTATTAPEPTATEVPTSTPEPAPDPVVEVSATDGVGVTADIVAAIAQAPDDGEVRLGPGVWVVDETILIDRPVSLVGSGVGVTELHSGSPATIVLLANTTAELRDVLILGTLEDEPADRLPLVVIENADVVVQNVEIRGSWGDGIFAFDGRGTIETVTVEDNRWSGIAFGGVSEMVVTDTVARRNGTGYGWLTEAAGMATGNTAEDNEGAGFAAQDDAAPTLSGNTARNNADGYQWSGSAGGVLLGNRSEANRFAGILVTDQASPEVRENDVTAAPGGEGIVVESEATPLVEDNVES